jgi:hypothetical protein
MARRGSADVGFLLVDGYDVLGLTTELNDDVEALIEETTALGDPFYEQDAVGGMKKVSIEQKGFYDDTALQSNDALVATLGTKRVVCYGINGNTLGAKAVGFTGAVEAHFERVAVRGQLHKANAKFEGSGQQADFTVLQPFATVAGTIDTNTGVGSVDNGALTSNGGVAYLQLNALVLGGFTNLTVKVRHSTDDITYVDLATFAAVTVAPGAQTVAVAGTVNRHLSATGTYSGAGGGNSAKLMVGFARL